MSQFSEPQSVPESEQQMLELRRLLLGDNGEVVKQVLHENARELVREVFSEALHDREKQDGSVNKVILPLVEKSVERSVADHSDQMVGYLYPLVGSLVRKSVTAFITDLLEKTNSLIENSLTIKGLKWRFKARQAGISFSQYVASQTFAFRVEQVFLIHRETGLLLNNLSAGLQSNADADLISSMLTAINDFVADSFRLNNQKGEQHLDVVKTDDFTLLIKSGPKALLVAAVTGNMPQKVGNQLQLSLEEIHRLYGNELNSFKGDDSPFEDCEQQLRECLISELKPENAKVKKRPWMALLLVLIALIFIGVAGIQRWQTNMFFERVQEIDNQPGILLTDTEIQRFSDIHFSVLRDPSAIAVTEWLTQHQLNQENITFKERSYVSLDEAIIKLKVDNVVRQYPTILLDWNGEFPQFNGEISNLDKLRLQSDLNKIPGLQFKTNWLESLRIAGAQSNAADDPTIIRAILDLNIAKLDRITITFEQSESALSESEVEKLFEVKEEFNNLVTIAEQQGLSLGLIIMGASDPSGSSAYNKALSQKRADTVKNKLQDLGIDKNRLNSIGLGIIELKTSGAGARKVLFNVVYFDAS